MREGGGEVSKGEQGVGCVHSCISVDSHVCVHPMIRCSDPSHHSISVHLSTFVSPVTIKVYFLKRFLQPRTQQPLINYRNLTKQNVNNDVMQLYPL